MAFIPFAALALSIFSASVAAQSSTDNPFTFGDGGDGSTTAGPTATPTGPVVTITLPGSDYDTQTVVGSMIASASTLSTIALGCPDGTSEDDCVFNPSMTVTAGPSTLGLTVIEGTVTVGQNCQWSAGGGDCTITQIGMASDVLDGTSSLASSDFTVITTVTSTISFPASAVAAQPVTITAGVGVSSSGSESGATGSSSSSSGTARSTGTSSTASSSSGAARSTGTSSAGAPVMTKGLVPGAVGAGVMGLAALLL